MPKQCKIKSAQDLWADGGVTEPLIALAPHELLCQRFQQTLAEMGVRWTPTIEMDSLDLIEKYVAAGYGIGHSVRLPEKKLPANVRAVELPGFPSLRLGVLHRRESRAGDTARHLPRRTHPPIRPLRQNITPETHSPAVHSLAFSPGLFR